jgi:hypothetical protein
MIEQATLDRLQHLETNAKLIISEFSSILQAKGNLDRYRGQYFKDLKIEQLDPYTIEASMLDATIRFRLVLAYSVGKPHARVICFRKYNLFDKEEYDFLGEFSINRYGVTDLPPTAHGETLEISSSADFVVLEYLDKAFEAGMKALNQYGC